MNHGINISESATSVGSPVTATAGLPVVVGTAPLNLAADLTYVNKPLLAFSKEEAVKALGYSSDWDNYTLCEFIDSHFGLFEVGPVVLINVLDPVTNKTSTADSVIPVTAGVAKINVDGVLLASVVVKLASAGTILVKNTDYTIGFDVAGKVVITRISASVTFPSNQATVAVTFDKLNPAAITGTEIIGGVNGTTGVVTGLELVNRVFPLFRLVPGQILCPGFSQIPTVAAVMKAKAGSINGLFKAIALTDADSSVTGADLYTEVPAWKNTNNFTDPLQLVFWPKVKLGGKVYNLSTQAAGVICKTDAKNDDIPFESPSNKSLQIDSIVTDAGAEIVLAPDQASYLNGEGIITALNWIGGWKLWGNRTGTYPGNTDVKDSFIPIRRMFNWVANTIILTYWSRVDNPTNKRLIDDVVNSLNIWLNGLTGRGALLGGRVEFRSSENPTSDLLNGTIRFHLFLGGPTPTEGIDFVLEYDVSYLSTLFAA